MPGINLLNIIALDLETAGLIPGKHVPLSIGAVKVNSDHTDINERNSFYAQLEWDSFTVDPNALRVNGLDIVNPPGRGQLFYKRSLPALEGIHAFSTWLGEPSGIPILALGKNVGSFDLPMLKSVWNVGLNRSWPFHYRSIDLNTLFVALSQITNRPLDAIKDTITARAWAAMVGQKVLLDGEQYTLAHNKHHALSDAWWNVYAWQECLRCFHDFGIKT